MPHDLAELRAAPIEISGAAVRGIALASFCTRLSRNPPSRGQRDRGEGARSLRLHAPASSRVLRAPPEPDR